MEEIWKDIEGYEGLYQISNLGRLKRTLFRNGKYEFKKEKILKGNFDKDKYIKYSLTKNSITKRYFCHRLVAQAFIPNPNNLPQVNHIDGNKQNNCVNNLEWVTSSENRLHSYKMGLNKKYYGIEHWNYNKVGKLHSQLKKILQYNLKEKFIKEWESIGEINRKLNISSGNICECCKGRRKQAGGYIWKYKEE